MDRTAWVGVPEGTRDILFSACALRRSMEQKAGGLFARWGYREVMSPTVEKYELFLRAGGALPEESMLKAIDRSGKVLVFRPESTTSMARVAAARLSAMTPPLRLFYIQDVFRCDAAHQGRALEIRQAGVELMGTADMRADLEIVSLAAHTLRALGFDDFRIEMGHAGILGALLTALSVDDWKREEIRQLIERKNFAALGDALAPLDGHPAALALSRVCRLFGGAEIWEEAALNEHTNAGKAAGELAAVYNALRCAGFGEYIQLDLGLAHALDYYTGLVFRAYVAGVGHAVITGGRYDNLAGRLGLPAPAVGFALDLDALCACVPPADEPTPHALVYFTPDTLSQALDWLQSHPGCVLSPCGTWADTLQLAKDKGIPQAIHIPDGQEVPIP